MGLVLDEYEAERIRGLDADARFTLAIDWIRTHAEVWTFETTKEIVAIWPNERLARLEAVGDAVPVCISLERWLANPPAGDRFVRVFPVGKDAVIRDVASIATKLRTRPDTKRRRRGRGNEPTRDLVRYVTWDELDIVLARIPLGDKKYLGDFGFRASPDATILGTARGGGTGDITLSRTLPIRVSLHRYIHPGQTAAEFGAPRLGQWPPWAVRRFLLYDVLFHEIGHLQVVGDDGAWLTRANRAREPRANAYADELRRTLYSEPFDHPDPVHNAPTEAELAMLPLWERLDKAQRASVAHGVIDKVVPDNLGNLSAEQQAFLARVCA